jgi:hypothetical protein
MRYLDIIHVINENQQQYVQILQPLVTSGAITNDQAQQLTDSARKKLKRNDRIVYPPILENINGIQDYSLYLEILEAELTDKSLVEDIDDSSVQFLNNLKKLGVAEPQIGNTYSYVFLIYTANKQLHMLGSKQPVELVKIEANSYTFADGKTYPDRRLTNLSLAVLYVFDKPDNLEKLINLIQLRWGKQVRNI